MNRIQFIQFLRRRYHGFFADIPEDDTIREYCFVLKPEWDFDKLQELFLTEWDNMRTPPPANFFSKFAYKVRTAIISPDSMDAVRKQDLINVAKWFCSDEYQHYHKTPPDYILLTIKQNNFTPEMINRMMMISDEVLNA